MRKILTEILYRQVATSASARRAKETLCFGATMLVAARGIRIAKIEKKLCVLYRTSVCAENAGGKLGKGRLRK